MTDMPEKIYVGKVPETDRLDARYGPTPHGDYQCITEYTRTDVSDELIKYWRTRALNAEDEVKHLDAMISAQGKFTD